MNDQPKEAVYLSLGTNLGNRESNLKAVIEQLPPQVQILDISPIYQTEPWGFLEQPKFLNQVLFGETSLTPGELLEYIKDVEKKIGRTPSFRYGPREVDIDILFYGDRIIQEEDLEIPHPRIKERAFVLVPLADLNPDLVFPGSEMTIADLLRAIEPAGVDPYQE